MGIEALVSTQIIDTTAVGRAVMTAADAAAARTAIEAVPTARTLTINGTSFDLSADRSWTVSGGISSLNGLTGATQTFAVGTSGTDFAIVSAAGAHTFNLPSASATARGVVTTGAQTFAGAKTFNSTINVGGSSAWYTIEGQGGFRLLLGNQGAAIGAGEGVSVRANDSFAWSNSAGNPGQNGRDLFLVRDAADVLAVRNMSTGTNAQAVRIYNTFTSSTSFERLNIAWAANICTIGTEAGSGGGTLRGLRIGGASSSLVGLWGATPIAQPTTAVAAATRVGGGGTALTDTDTFDGYTLAQIVKALRNIGALA